MKTPFRLVVGALLALATTIASTAFADDYPNKPIKVISDSAPGSAIDVTFRMVMDRLSIVLGQQIVAVDQPGASGAIAAHAASESIPDGYTLFAPALSLFISLPGKAENLPLYCLAISFRLARWRSYPCLFVRARNPASKPCRT